MSKETEIIAKCIDLLENGSIKERRPYMDALHEDGKCKMEGFIFQDKLWCWLVWKPTDIEKDPQWKGQELLKIVPKFMRDADKIAQVLDAQYWVYL